MSATELWAFVREQGLKPTELIVALCGALALITGPWLVWHTWRMPRNKRKYQDITGPFFTFVIGAACLFFSFALLRERYLLRPGAGRYTVASVTEHYSQRGRRKIVCDYYVNGQQWQNNKACGIANNRNLPCPALESRYYVYFSPEDPATSEITSVPVPDSVQVVPPLGWARLP